MPAKVLLKIPLLLSLMKYTYHGMTPPMQPPRQNEKERAPVPDFLAGMPGVQRVVIGVIKYIFCGLALAEALILLVEKLLPASLSSRILDALFLVLQPASAASAPVLQLTAVSALGCVLGTLGGLGRRWCHRTLGRFFTWEVAVRDGHQLVTSGPYAIVRHPSYSAWYLVMAGNFMLMFSRGSLFVESGCAQSSLGQAIAACSVVYMGYVSGGMLFRTGTEDKLLRKEFGAQWEHWAKRTRYRLIPWVY